MKKLLLSLFSLMLLTLLLLPARADAAASVKEVDTSASTDKYDLDGDGTKDTLSFATNYDQYESIIAFRVKINGQEVKTLSSIHAYKTNASVITLKNGACFLYLAVIGDNGDGIYGIYRYADGKLSEVIDLTSVDPYGYHSSGTIQKVSGNKVTVNCFIMSNTFGSIRERYTLTYKNGTLARTKTGTVPNLLNTEFKDYPDFVSPNGSWLTSTTDFDYYSTKTASKKKGTLKSGSVVKVVKVYANGSNVRYRLKKKGGGYIWIKAWKTIPDGFWNPAFEGLFYAG